MANRSNIVSGFLIAAVVSFAAVARAGGSTPPGRPLADALADLQARGLPLIFSSDLVRPEMRVAVEPPPGEPRRVLDQLLAPHGLSATLGPGGSLLIVRGPAPATAAAETPPAEAARFRDTVDVEGDAPSPTSLNSALDVRPMDVMAVAGAVENVHRAIQMLPGVAGVNELEGRVSVRGGGPDQNLTVMDGVEIHNPYRLFGIASAFNPETVEKFELVTGGFHPRYGDRLSSILVVDTRPGSRNRAFSGAVAASLTDANAVFEGRLPGHGSWLLTGRRTYYDLIFGAVADDADLPAFSDLQLKTSWELGGGRRLSLLALRNRESSVLGRDSEDEYHTRTRNHLVSARFTTPLGTRGTSSTVASWYDNADTMGLLNDTRTAPTGGLAELDWVELVVGREVELRDVSLRQEIGYQISPRHLLGAGFDAHSIGTGIAWRLSAGDRDDILRQEPWTRPDGPGSLAGTPLPSRFRGGLWVHDRFQASPRLTLEGGLRLDRGGLTADTTLSPRAAARLRLDDATVVGVAAGLHTQSTGFEKFLQRDLFLDAASLFDLTELPDGGLRSERAWHAVASIERRLLPSLDVRLEAFYKKFGDLVVGRLETEDERRARVAQYDFPAELQGSVRSEARVTRRPVNEGRGRAYGAELLLTRRAGPDSRFGGWIAYSMGRAEREAYGLRFPFEYDRPHALSLVGTFRPWRSLELSATARVTSGFPWTAPTGLRVQSIADDEDRDRDGNRTELVPRLSPVLDFPGVDPSLWMDSGSVYTYELDFGGVANRGSARGPAYKRVDLRASFHPRWWGGRWTLYIDVINALGRRNHLLPSWHYDGHPEQGPVTFRQDRDSNTGLPRLPSLGVRVRF